MIFNNIREQIEAFKKNQKEFISKFKEDLKKQIDQVYDDLQSRNTEFFKIIGTQILELEKNYLRSNKLKKRSYSCKQSDKNEINYSIFVEEIKNFK